MPANPISKKRQQEITDMIDNILVDTGMSYPEDRIESIIKRAISGVLIKESDFDNKHIRGAVFRKSEEYSRPLIAIRRDQPRRAKAWALAHEFGHYILEHNSHSNYLIDTHSFDGSSMMQNEGEANFFAMALLMPKNEFARLDLPFVSDKQLAIYFGVTEANVRVRRNWLRLNGY